MDYSKLNASCALAKKPKIALAQLELNAVYPIVGAKDVKTKFGPTVLLELNDHIIFLPQRSYEAVKGSIAELNKKTSGLKIVEILQLAGKNPTVDFQFVPL